MITKARAIEIIKDLLKTAQWSEMERGYCLELNDFDYYAINSGITDNELIELGFLPIDKESKEKYLGSAS